MPIRTPQNTTEEPKGEKKSDQPPQAKKPKVKTKLLDLPIENSPQWQLADDMLNLFVENEVSQHSALTNMPIGKKNRISQKMILHFAV